MSARRLFPALALATVLACWPMCDSSPAVVGFAPFELASVDPALGLQAEYSYEPAISADGHFVAFTGVVGSRHGVYRKDLATPGGALELVAAGTGAGAPSISANGQYVSFTSSNDPATGTPSADGCTQVYVRNMERNPKAQGAYEFVSARNGSAEPLIYEGSNTPGCPGGGSASANRVAISAVGGRVKVAFTVIGRSDLIGDSTKTETPPQQIAVRELDSGLGTRGTMLVSVENQTKAPVEGGAALSGSPSLSEVRRANGEKIQVSRDNVSTAAISSDGSTVAWMGLNVGQQVPVGPRTEQFVSTPQPVFQYAEPLWRRIGGAEPTRRVLAGDQPECPPRCPGGLDLRWDEQQEELGETPKGPQRGSYVAAWRNGFGVDFGAVTPGLSANGQQVAILSTQPDYGHLPDFGPSATNSEKTPTANAFVVNMAAGLTREQAITRLTEWGSPNFSDAALDGSVNDIAISGDGTRVAFATVRSVFPLAPPALVTPPVSQLEPAQLYEANLQAGTLALVSQGYNGEPANIEEGRGGVAASALSQDGSVLALASGSSNLAYGTVNEGSAVFITREQNSPASPGRQSVSPLPPGPAETGWSISVTLRASSQGALLVDVSVPGAGRLTASASAPVPTTVARAQRSGKQPRRARAKRSLVMRGGHASAARARTQKVTVIATRPVARATVLSGTEEVLTLRLLPFTAYRSLASGKGGLYATISVTFAAPGHRTLTQTLHASFPRTPVIRGPSKTPAGRQGRRSGQATGRGHA
jgi:hypothetical protein